MTTTTRSEIWDTVEEALSESKAIAWDTCHKIYVLMDDNQVALMRTYGYDPIVTSDEATPSEMLETLKSWFNQSCVLKFISAIETNEENPNEGFSDLIPQGYEDEFCTSCDKAGANFSGYCDECEEEEEEEEIEFEDEDEE